MRSRTLLVLAGAALLTLAAFSGRFLVVDQVQTADAIVVLAGETEVRPARGADLLNRGYAPVMILDVPDVEKVYGWSQTELAQRYVQQLPHADRIRICPIMGRSTQAEVHDAAACLQQVPGRRILLVTSEYHTQRAVRIFSKEDPSHDYSVAAAFDPREFGVNWWQRRQWAKTNFYEWVRLLWWELVDRW